MNTKEKVNQLFANLRKKHGFVARQNFMCCSSCAAYEIAINPRNYGRLYAFYNRQSNDAWELGRRDRKPTGRLKDTLYIQFGLVRGGRQRRDRANEGGSSWTHHR